MSAAANLLDSIGELGRAVRRYAIQRAAESQVMLIVSTPSDQFPGGAAGKRAEVDRIAKAAREAVAQV